MSKKKEIKKIFENMELESSEAHAELGGPTGEDTGLEGAPSIAEGGGDEDAALRAEMRAEDQKDHTTETMETSSVVEQAGEEKENQTQEESVPASEGDEISPEDLLEDVRRSLLLEDETQEEQEQQSWWRRIGRSSRKKSTEEGASQPTEEINLPPLGTTEGTDQPETIETDEYQEQIDELIDLLDTDTEDEPVDIDAASQSPEVPAEPEKPVDLEELKKQAFQSRPDDAGKANLTEVRSIALQEGEDVFVEVEATPQDPLEERLSAVENSLQPYRRYIYFGIAFLGLIMAVLAGLLMFNVYQRSMVQAAPTVVSNLPFPTSVGLPGGWQFNLGKGSLTSEGRWNPAGAEWLQGTEVCRWVALPYSRQLEAVIRTLNPDDPIELGMSNNDKLTYNVYSIKQMSPEEMRELDSNSPCLLIVLAEPDAEKRWVLTALP